MVKINEFYDQPIDDSLPYNVVDDVCIFMRNDPMFYRKSFFPAIKRMQECSMSETEYDKIKELGPMIDKAARLYCSKFKVGKRPEELLTKEDKYSLIQKVYAEEMTEIRKGTYK
jgi:hypothetical protein